MLRLDVGLNQEAYEPFEPVYHEYVHYLTRQLISRLPLWMVEGLAEFYGNTQIKSKDVYVGAPSATNLLYSFSIAHKGAQFTTYVEANRDRVHGDSSYELLPETGMRASV